MSGERFIRITLVRDERHLIKRVWDVIQKVDGDAPPLIWTEDRYPAWTTAVLRPVTWGPNPIPELNSGNPSGSIFYRKCPLTTRMLARLFSRAGAYGRVSVTPCFPCSQLRSHDFCYDQPEWTVFNPVEIQRRRVPSSATMIKIMWPHG